MNSKLAHHPIRCVSIFAVLSLYEVVTFSSVVLHSLATCALLSAAAVAAHLKQQNYFCFSTPLCSECTVAIVVIDSTSLCDFSTTIKHCVVIIQTQMRFFNHCAILLSKHNILCALAHHERSDTQSTNDNTDTRHAHPPAVAAGAEASPSPSSGNHSTRSLCLVASKRSFRWRSGCEKEMRDDNSVRVMQRERSRVRQRERKREREKERERESVCVYNFDM